MTFTNPAITIILPVYNGSDYLEKTLNCILQQTFNDFELICVDDSSSDNSFEILKHFAAKDNRIKLFQKENGGTAIQSIILALQYARGKYMFYSSQDDLMSNDLLEHAYKKAVETDADAVLMNLIYYSELQSKTNELKGLNFDKNKVLTGEQAFRSSLSWKIHGFSLRRMSLVKELGYTNFAMNSDEYTTREFYLNCNKIVFSEGTFYYRQDNNNALTKQISTHLFNNIETDLRLINLIISHKQSRKCLILMVKRTLGSIINLYQILYKHKYKFSKQEVQKAQLVLKKAWESTIDVICKEKLYGTWMLLFIKGLILKMNYYQRKNIYE